MKMVGIGLHLKLDQVLQFLSAMDCLQKINDNYHYS